MDVSEYSRMDAVALADLVRTKQVTAVELGRIAVNAVKSLNPELNAVVSVNEDLVENLAFQEPHTGVLSGVPILNKDLTPEEGSLLEMGSELTRGFVSPYTCEFLRKLLAAGVTNIGRSTTLEFGLASVTESRIAGVTRNPWDTERTPGGSSGGAAAMIAAGAVPVATGSDGGGSIRSLGAHCGIVGLKPTRGRISQAPLPDDPISGLAVHFVLTCSVRDTAVALDVTLGLAPGDAYGFQPPAGAFTLSLHPPKRKLRIGYTTTSWGGDRASRETSEGVVIALRMLAEHGHAVQEARPEFAEEAFAKATLDIWCTNTAFAIDDLAHQMGRKQGDENLQSSTMAFYRHGLTVSSSDILSALSVFNDVNLSVGRFFGEYDLLVTPTCMTTAPLIGDVQCDLVGVLDAAAWSKKMNGIDAFMPIFNTTGHPAISLPLHWSEQGLPVGVQFVAPFGDEATLLQVGSFFEEALPWNNRRPPIYAGGSMK
ncbi:MAG: hypothetical protein PPHERAN_4599 [uncultured Paraburkholderia sp.]|nr:MAG: hypothetical protein PPHERAN_4599 [uncultured Paraburkholderia sp.]